MVLSYLTLVVASLFSGAAVYINLVEHPARWRLADGPMLAQWQSSYARALPIQSGLAAIGTVLGVLAWSRSGQWQMLAASGVLFANWPYTLAVMMPVNKRLQAMDAAAPDPAVRQLLGRWNGLHGIRSGLGALSVAIGLWALSETP